MAAKLIPMNRLGPEKGIDYSRAQIYRKIKAGSFPRPVRMGENRIAFAEQEIDAWIMARIADRDAAAESEAA